MRQTTIAALAISKHTAAETLNSTRIHLTDSKVGRSNQIPELKLSGERIDFPTVLRAQDGRPLPRRLAPSCILNRAYPYKSLRHSATCQRCPRSASGEHMESKQSTVGSAV